MNNRLPIVYRPCRQSLAPQCRRWLHLAPRDRQLTYHPPRLAQHGPLGALIRGSSWKGVDSVGALDPDSPYPG